jgi:hypothetical protein
MDRLDDAQVAALAEICALLLDGGGVVPAARDGAARTTSADPESSPTGQTVRG